MINPQSWPTDPRECHDLLSRFAQQVEDLHAATEDLHAALDQAAKLHDQTVQEHQQTIDELRRQIELYRRYVFGPRRERLVEAPGQGHLFELDEADESLTLPPEPPARDSRPPAQPRRSRKPDYDRLPQVRIEHDVPEAEKLCSQVENPRHASARMRPVCCSSSPPTLNFMSTSCPSMPVPTAATVWSPPSLRHVP